MMKKNWTNLFLLMALAVLPLTSCENNEEPQKEQEEQKHDPTSDADQVKAIAYDGLSWLQGSLVVVDKNGDVFRRVYGEALDASQPDVISVPVADSEAAKELFLSWVAPGKEATEVEDGYDYYITDTEGNAKGCVKFRGEEADPRILARMTITPDTKLKHISEVQFIDYELWPENADYPVYEAGKIYEIEEYVLTWSSFKAEKKPLPFYCIQGNTDGKEGILVWLSPDADDVSANSPVENYMDFALHYLPTEEEAEKVCDFYNNNPAFWANMLKEMDAKGYMWSPNESFNSFSTGNSEFVLNAFYENWLGIDTTLLLDLDDEEGKIDYVTSWNCFNYRYMHIMNIPPVAE